MNWNVFDGTLDLLVFRTMSLESEGEMLEAKRAGSVDDLQHRCCCDEEDYREQQNE